MDPADAKTILAGMELADMLMGSGELKCLDSEQVSRRNARRSLVAMRDIASGEVLSAGMFTAKRPGHGVSPARLSEVVGRRAAKDIPADAVLLEEMLES